MQNCRTQKKIPFGFYNTYTAPTIQLSHVNVQTWDSAIFNFRMSLLDITIQQSMENIRALESQIDIILKTSPGLPLIILKELQHYIHKKEREVINTKRRKALRDNVLLDFFSPLIEKWKNFFSRLINRTQHTNPCNSEHSTDLGGEKSEIFNYSSYVISKHEEIVLKKGLKFCPTPRNNSDDLDLHKGLNEFARQLHCKVFFKGAPYQEPLYKHKSYWIPPLNKQNVNVIKYIEAVQKDILSAYKKDRPLNNNLTYKDRQCLKNLTDNRDIIIAQADKGGGICIVNTADYVSEAIKQLNDTKFYKKLDYDPTLKFRETIKTQLKYLVDNKKIEKNISTYLIQENPRPGQFYMLMKVHKQNHPGRPIISGIGTNTENISAFIDEQIKSTAAGAPSYVKDSSHFLNLINDIQIDFRTNSTLLVTMDVVSLYTNIPHDEGIQAVLNIVNENDLTVSKSVLNIFMHLALELNNFTFMNEHYLQIHGAAMGSRFSPSYANIYMMSLEERLLNSFPHKPLFYKRFLDDIFIIWNNGEDKLFEFINFANNFNPHIKFTYKYSDTEIEFLDIKVRLTENGLKTTLYRKPTDRRQFLHYKSCHPIQNKKGIPYSQMLRLRRLCSEDNDFDIKARALGEDFINRGYPLPLINNSISKSRAISRNACLVERPKRNNHELRLILPYQSKLPNINNILRRHMNILHMDTALKAVIPRPPGIAFKRPRNLLDLFKQSRNSIGRSLVPIGCTKCNHNQCSLCGDIIIANSIRSTANNFNWKINGTFDCNSENVIYLIQCRKCQIQYIGETKTSIRKRMNLHKSHIRKHVAGPVSRHLNSAGHNGLSDFNFIILQGGFRTTRDRKNKESEFIYRFNTLEPKGLNSSKGSLPSFFMDI